MAVNSYLLNDAFVNAIKDDSKKKLAEDSTSYTIRDKIREAGFMGKILPATGVDVNKLIKEEDRDDFYLQVDIEPGSEAMTVSFRGEPNAKYFNTRRVKLAFTRLATPIWQKTEEELLASNIPITDMLKKWAVPDIQAMEDYHFLQYSYLAATHSSNVLTATTEADPYALIANDSAIDLKKHNLVRLLNQFPKTERRAAKLLMNEQEWNDVLLWQLEEIGDKVGDTAFDGLTNTTLLGLPVIRTIKTPMLPEGNVYAFTSPEYFGVAKQLYDIKLWTDVKANKLEFMLWKSIGMVIVATKSIAVLQNWRGSAKPAGSIPTDLTEKDVLKYYYESNGLQPSLT